VGRLDPGSEGVRKMTLTKSQKRRRAARNKTVRKARGMPEKPVARKRKNPRRGVRDVGSFGGEIDVPGFGRGKFHYNEATPRKPRNLSDCAVNYALSLSNPFASIEACIPDYPVLLTRKIQTFIRGTVQTSSTTGIGYLICTPEYGIANDLNTVLFTTPSYTLASIDLDGTQQGAKTNSEYPQASFGASAILNEFRVLQELVPCHHRCPH
jgi:hypothetical protein